MHRAYFFTCWMLVLSFTQAMSTGANALALTFEPRGSSTGSRSPSPAKSSEKVSAQATHSTRLFGVDLSHGREKSPAAHTAHSTRLFGVTITPAPHESHSTHSHARPSTDGLEHPGNGKQTQQQSHSHPHKPASSNPHERPAQGMQHIKGADQSAGKREQWWKKAGGRPRYRQGSSPDYERLKRYREKKKLEKALSLSSHASAHEKRPPGGPGGPGSPGAGTHAVSKRRLQVVNL